jgi:peptidoglycan/LPS O-acetylase OafA/YrhL
VIFAHTTRTRGFPAFGHQVAIDRVATVGVDVFFVLSGFLITTLLCREVERSRTISLRSFYWRRALRIIPAYLSFLLFVLGLSLAGHAEIARSDWVAAATYTMNFRAHPAWEVGHIWSLSIEEHFYVLWPPLFAVLPRRAATWALCLVLVIEPILRTAVLFWSPAAAMATELWTFMRLDAIAAGCLLAVVSRSPAGVRKLDLAMRYWPVPAALIVASVAGSMLSGKIDVAVAPTLEAFGIAAVVWVAIRSKPRWLENRVLVVIGVGSYSLYLWQEIFLNPMRSEWQNRFPENVALVGLFAALSYRVIERPFLRMKGRHARAYSSSSADVR